jgi:serine/threonine protein kinase/WD40 repeat protein
MWWRRAQLPRGGLTRTGRDSAFLFGMTTSTSDSANEAVLADWEPGDTILGLYRVQELLGRGGMGTVYRVHHSAWGIDLAVKRPKADVFRSSQGAKLFETECQTWIKLGLHPNVVTCYYARRIEDIPHVFAEYISGGTLSNAIRDGVLYEGDENAVLTRMLDYAIQFARGLLHAHEHSLVHHDVKPANVLLTPEGELKVTDFGMAGAIAMAGSDTSGGHRSATNPRGTPLYSSPEQARREPMTVATDIWSYALSVLEMFVGDSTWMAGQTAPAALRGYLELGPERDDIPEMPRPVAELVDQCFQIAPADRPKSMEPIIEALESCYEEAAGEEYNRMYRASDERPTDRLSNKAVTLLDLGNKAEAEQTWRELLKQEPAHAAGVYNQALHLWRSGKMTDISVLKRIGRLREQDPDAWAPVYQCAEVHIERGDAEYALRILHTVKDIRVDKHEFRSVRQAAKEWLKQSRKVSQTFSGHAGPATAVAISWDGRMALSAAAKPGGDADVYLWASATGKLVGTFHGHSGAVRALDISGNGKFVVSAGEDGNALVWHLQSGRLARTFSNHDGPVNGARFSEDGDFIITADGGGAMRVWNIHDGDCMGTVKAHDGPITALCLAEFGRGIMTAGQDCNLRFWDVTTGKLLRSYKAEGGPISSGAVSANRRYAVAASEDGYLQVWDLQTDKTSGAVRAHGQAILSVALSRKGRNALTSAGDGKFRLWDMRTGRCIITLTGNSPIALTGDSQHAITADEATGLYLWRIRCEQEEYVAPFMLCSAHASKRKRRKRTHDAPEPE